MKKLQYCVYVLLSYYDSNFYTGYTSNLKRRLTEHFNGKNVSTKSRRPLILVYCEYFYSVKDAKRREIYLKTSSGKKGLKLIIRDTISELKGQNQI